MPELGPDEHERKWDQLFSGRQLRSGQAAEKTRPFSRVGEYGGVDGLIQPAPHDTVNSAYEQLLLIRGMDPGARGEEPDATELPEGLIEPEIARFGKGQRFNPGSEIKVSRETGERDR